MIDRNDQDHNFGFNAEVSKYVTLRDRYVHADFLKYFQNCYWLFVCYLGREKKFHYLNKRGIPYYCLGYLAILSTGTRRCGAPKGALLAEF